MTPRIVGISGQMNSGKDTAADRLITKFGFTKVALADPIKRYALRVFHFSEEQLWGSSTKRNELDPRFQTFVDETEGDDAWMAVFRRADTYNKQFVEELFPDSPILRGQAHASLCKWLVDLATEYPQVSPRIMLQSMGTEWGRSVQADVWVRYTIRVAQQLLAGGYSYTSTGGLEPEEDAFPPAGVVLSDVRFANELTALRAANGFLIRVKRPDTDGNAAGVGIEDHPSEKEQKDFRDDQFNFIIANTGSLDTFLEAVDVAGFILTGVNK